MRYPISLEFLNEIWIPNVFIYNLKTFQNVAVLKKLAGYVLKRIFMRILEIFLLRCLDHWGYGCVLQPVHHSDLHVPHEVGVITKFMILLKMAPGMRSFPWTPTSASSEWAPLTWTSTT